MLFLPLKVDYDVVVIGVVDNHDNLMMISNLGLVSTYALLEFHIEYMQF